MTAQIALSMICVDTTFNCRIVLAQIGSCDLVEQNDAKKAMATNSNMLRMLYLDPLRIQLEPSGRLDAFYIMKSSLLFCFETDKNHTHCFVNRFTCIYLLWHLVVTRKLRGTHITYTAISVCVI